MGLFDYVRLEVPLPDGGPTDIEWQTKTFDDPYMETYTIRADGRLIHKPRWWVKDDPERDTDFHGILNFYGGGREFNAKFTDGKLVEIRAVEQSP